MRSMRDTIRHRSGDNSVFYYAISGENNLIMLANAVREIGYCITSKVLSNVSVSRGQSYRTYQHSAHDRLYDRDSD